MPAHNAVGFMGHYTTKAYDYSNQTECNHRQDFFASATPVGCFMLSKEADGPPVVTHLECFANRLCW
jgi:hypothetical protein